MLIFSSLDKSCYRGNSLFRLPVVSQFKLRPSAPFISTEWTHLHCWLQGAGRDSTQWAGQRGGWAVLRRRVLRTLLRHKIRGFSAYSYPVFPRTQRDQPNMDPQRREIWLAAGQDVVTQRWSSSTPGEMIDESGNALCNIQERERWTDTFEEILKIQSIFYFPCNF